MGKFDGSVGDCQAAANCGLGSNEINANKIPQATVEHFGKIDIYLNNATPMDV